MFGTYSEGRISNAIRFSALQIKFLHRELLQDALSMSVRPIIKIG
jgi:hypothetical protein